MKKRTTIRAALAGLACLGATLTTVAPAHAYTCYANTCDGKGPVASGCADDGVASASYSYRNAWGVATVQLEWARACHSFWARGNSLNTGSDGGTDSAGYDVRIEKRRKSDNALLYSNKQHVASNTGFYDWTLMAGVTSTTKVRACLNMPVSHSGDGLWHCTGYLSI